jgi:hypothetical protein
MVLHQSGGLSIGLASLNTMVGLAIFGVLWLTTWWSTRALTRAARSNWSWLGLGMVWGGVNGALFIVGTFAVVLLVELPVQGPGLLLAVGAVVFPLVIAFGVGAVVGLVFAALDLVLIQIAQWIVRE